MAAPSDPGEFTARDRRAVSSVATQFFVNGAVFASFIPRLPEIRDRIDISTAVLGALITAAATVGVAGSVGAAHVIERFGTRWTLIGGAALLVATLPIIGFATVPLVFLLGLAAMQAFDVVVDIAMNLQGSWLSARRHAPIMNRLHGLWSLGTVVGGVTAAQMAESGISLQTHLVAVAAVLVVVLFFVGPGLLTTDVQPSDPDATSRDSGPPTRSRLAIGLLACAGAFAIAVEIVSSDWAAFRLSDDLDTTAGIAGMGYVAFACGMTAGRFGGDWVLVRIGSRRLLDASIVVSIIGLTLAASLSNHFLVLSAYLLTGVGVSTFFPTLYDTAAQLPGRRGAGLGALTAGSRVTALVVPITVGSLAATSLSVGAATAIVTLPSAIGFAVVMWLHRRRLA